MSGKALLALVIFLFFLSLTRAADFSQRDPRFSFASQLVGRLPRCQRFLRPPLRRSLEVTFGN
jgi:hypothetical protein